MQTTSQCTGQWRFAQRVRRLVVVVAVHVTSQVVALWAEEVSVVVVAGVVRRGRRVRVSVAKQTGTHRTRVSVPQEGAVCLTASQRRIGT